MTNLTTTSETIRIFIGSSARNVVEEKVFKYTLIEQTNHPLEINIIEGQTGAARFHSGEVKPLPPGLRGQLKGATAFSLGRYAIPYWCGYEGKAIYCDSDIVARADIAELWNLDLQDAAMAAVPVKQAKSSSHYVNTVLKSKIVSDDKLYLTSVMLIDCAKFKDLDTKKIIDGYNAGEYTYSEMMFVGGKFRNKFGFSVKDLSDDWNHLDICFENSKLVHFTDLTSQPWLFPHNPVADLWESIFIEAVEKGALKEEEIVEAYEIGVISQRVRTIPYIQKDTQKYINNLWRGIDVLSFQTKTLIKAPFTAIKNRLKKIRKISLDKKTDLIT